MRAAFRRPGTSAILRISSDDIFNRQYKHLEQIDDSSARGAIAQLGERLHGMQEVGGSIPPGSTKSD